MRWRGRRYAERMIAAAHTMPQRVAAYLGLEPGGVDLGRAIAALPFERLGAFARALERRRDGSGRVFFLGNGGSYDNARLLAARCRAHGLRAQVPGQPDDYLMDAARHGYAEIYRRALVDDRIGPADMVVGISGSGNSPNVLSALGHAQSAGADAWCLGGRDGGAMAKLCGDQRSLIGVNHCMEAIEDLHVAMVLIALDALGAGGDIAAAAARFQEAFHRFATRAACAGIAAICDGMLASIRTGGRVFVLGTTIGASHIRADLGRGATNAIPVRGIAAPEFFSMNSAQATANDDGLDFVLVDGLVKFEPHARDLAVLCELPGDRAAISHCRELLSATGTPTITVGAGGIDLSAFAAYDEDSALAMIGHICGECIRACLHEEWQARRVDLAHEFPAGARKLGRGQTDQLERDLAARGVLAPGEQLTFCYGALYAVRPPSSPPARCYY